MGGIKNVQGDKNAGGKGLEGSFQIKLSLVFKKIPRSLVVLDFWDCLGVGWLTEREGESDKMVKITNWKVLAFGG